MSTNHIYIVFIFCNNFIWRQDVTKLSFLLSLSEPANAGVPINFNTEFCYFLLMVRNFSLVRYFHGECLLLMKNFQTLKVHDCYQEPFFSAHIIQNMLRMSIMTHMTCKLSESFFLSTTGVCPITYAMLHIKAYQNILGKKSTVP